MFKFKRNFLNRKKLEWTATHKHNFHLEIYTPFFPPFYSTNLFLPRININLINKDNKIYKANVEVEVRKYDGDISSVSTVNDNWGDTGDEGRLQVENWEPGTKRAFVATIPGRRLPSSGTYIVRIRVLKWIPRGTVYEELLKELKKNPLKENVRQELLSISMKQMEEFGIDPHRLQLGTYKGEEVFNAKVVEYFRIEEFSNVLNFWLIVVTIFLGLVSLLSKIELSITI